MPFESTLMDRLGQLRIRTSEEDVRYMATYPVLLEYFRRYVSCSNPREDDAKAAVILIYTWMAPAKLQPACLHNFETARNALVRCGTGLFSEDDVNAIRSFVGGSLIATSKFLHFYKPESFAIWDRRVAWAGYRFRWPYEYNVTSRYIEYLNDLRGLELPIGAAAIVRGTLGDTSPARAKEFALFHLGIAEQTEE